MGHCVVIIVVMHSDDKGPPSQYNIIFRSHLSGLLFVAFFPTKLQCNAKLHSLLIILNHFIIRLLINNPPVPATNFFASKPPFNCAFYYLETRICLVEAV